MSSQSTETISVLACEHCQGNLVIASDGYVYCPNGHGGVPIEDIVERLQIGGIRHYKERLN